MKGGYTKGPVIIYWIGAEETLAGKGGYTKGPVIIERDVGWVKGGYFKGPVIICTGLGLKRR